MYGLIPFQSPIGLKSSRLSWVSPAAMLVDSKAVVTEAAVSPLVLVLTFVYSFLFMETVAQARFELTTQHRMTLGF